MNILKPTLADIPELLGLWKKQYDYHHDIDTIYYVAYSEDLKDEFEKYLTKAINDDDPRILVAKDDAKIVGFITFKEDEESYFDTQIKKFGVVIELYVSDQSRAQGIGKALMREAENFFASKELTDVKLFCSSFNTNTLNFYSHIGYVQRQSVLFKKI